MITPNRLRPFWVNRIVGTGDHSERPRGMRNPLCPRLLGVHAELRCSALLGGLNRAPNLDALRKLLRQMFERVSYIPGPCGANLAFTLKWDLIDADLLAAGRDPLIRQRLDLPLGVRTSEHEGFPLDSHHLVAEVVAPGACPMRASRSRGRRYGRRECDSAASVATRQSA